MQKLILLVAVQPIVTKRGKLINAKNALSLWLLPRLPGAISHGNNAAKADF